MAKAENILKDIKINADFWELMGSGVLKYFEEILLQPYIGNGTYFSGAIKLFAGAMMKNAGLGKFGDMLSTAFIIDGTEDITRNLVKYVPVSVASPNNQQFETI